MPWWASVYLAFLLVLTIWSISVDRKANVAAWRIGLDAVSMAVWAWFVVAYFRPALAETVGRWTLAAFVAALVWTGIGVHRDIADMRPDPDLTCRENFAAELVGVGLGAIALAPAVTLALLVMRRAW